MKNIFFLMPVILLTACASKKPVVVQMPRSVPGTTLPAEDIESVRYAENLKAYPIGRYVDPNNQLVMHEAHTVYRVETTTKWNLHPNAPVSVPTGPVVRIVDPAHHPAPVNAEVAAEISRQKFATQALLDRGAKLDETLSQLSGAFRVTKDLGDQAHALRNELTITQKRLDAFEQELRKKQADAVVGAQQKTNEW
ncbi:MAG: hypothetical protein SFY81_02785 [Verrucomicrobiota bacterium]|nr:hypothetical protein [Verrucomicrobiota bacterium]